eukprot:COSAG01_NODE_1623_length_9708_cov_32.044438_8_plen_110_part_00
MRVFLTTVCVCGIQRCATCKLTVHVCTSGNEDWTSAMAEKMGMTAAESWRPWLVDQVPAGYVTVYENPAGVANFTFVSDMACTGSMVGMPFALSNVVLSQFAACRLRSL